MRNVRITIWVAAAVLIVFGFCLPKAGATVYFNDGGTHTIDYAINDDVWVTNTTTVNLLTGASIAGKVGSEGGQVNIFDGWIGGELSSDGFSSTLNMFGGTVDGRLSLDWNAQGYVNGGSINGGASLGPETHLFLDGGEITGGASMVQCWMSIYDGFLQGDIEVSQGTVYIQGGIIEGGLIAEEPGYFGIDEGFVIWGTDFRINNTPVGYGTYTYMEYPTGNLTGMLLNGDPIDVQFQLDLDEPLVLMVPEPSTLLLLGLGAVMVRRKR